MASIRALETLRISTHDDVKNGLMKEIKVTQSVTSNQYFTVFKVLGHGEVTSSTSQDTVFSKKEL